MEQGVAGTWPEQDAIHEWCEKYGIALGHAARLELAEAVTAPRIRVQKKLDEVHKKQIAHLEIKVAAAARAPNSILQELPFKPAEEAKLVYPGLAKYGDLRLKQPTVSDGSTASYYELPAGARELQDLIAFRNMNAQIGEIFRAVYRYGQVAHSPRERDLKKIIFYAQAELDRLAKYPGAQEP